MKKILLAIFCVLLCPWLVAQTLSNDGVIRLVKAGLSEDVVIATINASAGTYDTSTDALIALKAAGVSDKIIAAMVVKGSGNTPAPIPPPGAANGLPAGIDEVGVYYQDKTGSWVSLMPEIVNFKSGGALKAFATNGIVKGDMNGHINGAKAKVDVAFPTKLAVYVPEGTEITEYQLLRLRPNKDSREFRSVTGGVFHVSGGATRDAVPFQPTKIAPRVYQIMLESALGKGEYGLLPPGSVGSSNMGSSGKIYAVSVIE